MRPSADEIIEWLALQSPTTCGYVAEPYRSTWQIPASALPPGFAGERPLGNVFYFLVTPSARVHLHRIRSDQMYHHYLGDPLEVLLLYADGRSEVKLVGSDLARACGRNSSSRAALFTLLGSLETANTRCSERRSGCEPNRPTSKWATQRHSPIVTPLRAIKSPTSFANSAFYRQRNRTPRRPADHDLLDDPDFRCLILPLRRAVVHAADVEAAVGIVATDRPRVARIDLSQQHNRDKQQASCQHSFHQNSSALAMGMTAIAHQEF